MFVGHTLAPLTPMTTTAAGRSIGPGQIAGAALIALWHPVAPQPAALLGLGAVGEVVAEAQLALLVQRVDLTWQLIVAIVNVLAHKGLQTGLVGFPIGKENTGNSSE